MRCAGWAGSRRPAFSARCVRSPTPIDRKPRVWGAAAIEPLTLALRHSSRKTAEHVAGTLATIGVPAAVEVLLATTVVPDDDWLRETAMKDLAGVRNPEALEPLVAAAFTARQPGARHAAQEALWALNKNWYESGTAKTIILSCLAEVAHADSYQRREAVELEQPGEVNITHKFLCGVSLRKCQTGIQRETPQRNLWVIYLVVVGITVLVKMVKNPK